MQNKTPSSKQNKINFSKLKIDEYNEKKRNEEIKQHKELVKKTKESMALKES